jgi:hypothetical protein
MFFKARTFVVCCLFFRYAMPLVDYNDGLRPLCEKPADQRRDLLHLEDLGVFIHRGIEYPTPVHSHPPGQVVGHHLGGTAPRGVRLPDAQIVANGNWSKCITRSSYRRRSPDTAVNGTVMPVGRRS